MNIPVVLYYNLICLLCDRRHTGVSWVYFYLVVFKKYSYSVYW